MKLCALLALCALVTLPQAAISQRNPGAESCFDIGSQAQAKECLESRSAASEQALQAAEKTALTALREWDDTPGNRKRSIDALQQANQQFRVYRSAQCNLQATLAAGGTGTAHRRLLCLIELNERRVADLAAIQVARP